jgi:hypothetical protein
MVVKMTTLCKKLFGWMRKESKPFIRFYSLEPGTATLFPIVKSASLSRNFLTQTQPGDQPDTLSSKNCPGIKKIVSSGWIVTAPADFSIVTNGDGVSFDWGEPYRFSKGTPGMDAYVNSHTRSQTEPLLDDSITTLKTVVKIETPWRIEASDDTVLLLLPVTYNNESRFSAATGILDPKYGHVVNIQLFWKVLNDVTTIKAGTPLVQIVPISRKALSGSYYDVTIDVATPEDAKKEQEFNYASNCAFLANDSLSSRLSRVITVLNKYKTKG